MKNRVIRSLLAISLTAAMIAANTGVVSAAEVTKSETVYVKTDAGGNAKSVTVSDQIKNIGGVKDITDISRLTDIENVKGEETFSKSGETMTWKNDGSNEICYQGTTDAALPVGMKISYKLDGKEISAEELSGKSGHLKVEVSFENYLKGEEYVPFLMATGIVLDGDVFTNVEVENGKLISDGERQVATGFGMPGLKDYLKSEDVNYGKDIQEYLDDLKVGDSFTFEADIKDYDKITCMSVATADLFSDVDTDHADSLDDLKDSMSELEDAAEQLVNGTGALKDGMDTLLSSSGTLIDGVKALADGSKELSAGTGTLSEGSKTLKDGAAALSDGTKALKDGSSALVNGAYQVKTGAGSAKSGAKQLDDGLSAVQSGVSDMKTQTSEGIGALTAGAGSLVDGIAQVKAGADQVAGSIGQAQAGASSLSAGLANAKAGTEGMVQLAGGISQAAGAIPTSVTKDNVSVEVYVDNRDIRNNVAAALQSAGADEAMISAALSVIGDKSVPATTSVTVDVSAETGTVIGYSQQLAATASAVDAGLADLQTGAGQLESALGTLAAGAGSVSAALAPEGDLSTGAAALQSGIGTLGFALNDGTKQLLAGIGQLQTGSSELGNGLSALEAGASQVSGGTVTLDNGIKAADQGAKQLSDGTAALSSGAKELDAGAKQLASGLDELLSGSGALVDGVTQLDDGAGELNDGMSRFKKDGIQRITDLLDGNLQDVLDKFNGMADRAKEYKTFSGLDEKMNGDVKFIFMMEE